MTSLTQQLIGRCAVLKSENDPIQVDLTGLIRRLVLFDKFTLESIRLKELPFLLNVFGFDGFATLLKSGVLAILCDAMTIGQTGQLGVLKSRAERGCLPLGSYAFSIVRTAYWQSYFENCLRVLDTVNSISAIQRNALRDLLSSSVIRYPGDFGKLTLAQLKTDLVIKRPMIERILIKTLQDRLNTTISEGDIGIRVHQIGDNDFKVETNIARQFHLTELDAHKLIERALLAAGGLNQRIEEMQTYSAISGFLPEEVPIFADKLDFLVQTLLPQPQEKRLHRILDIRGIPELDKVNATTIVDVDKLLKIRDSSECKEFRSWLSTVDYASDKEIKEKVGSLQAQLSTLAHTRSGKGIRFLTITGISTITGIILAPVIGATSGIVLGALDHFLLEKLFPNSGPASFINRLYPSIFKKN